MRKGKAKVALCAVLGLELMLGGCSTFIKNTIMSSPPGRFAANFFRSMYCVNNDKDFFIRVPENFYSRMNGEDEILLMIHGFGSSADDLGSMDDPNSPVRVAADEFDGKILIANYPSKYTIQDVSERLLSVLEDVRSKYPGEFPRMYVLGHSMGGEVARYMARSRPEYFRNVGLAGAPSEGVDFGAFTSYVSKNYPWLLDLETKGERTCIDDLFRGSDFFRKINTPTKPLDISYSFFAFVNDIDDNRIIPGPDDALVPLFSAYPYDMIRQKKFEDVQIDDLVIFEGDVNHHTFLFNPEIMRYMLRALKEEKPITKAVPTYDDAVKYTVLEPSPYELSHRDFCKW